MPEADVGLFAGIVRKAATESADLDAIIGAHLAENWPLARLDPVLRALLRAATAELRDGQAPARQGRHPRISRHRAWLFTAEEPRFAAGVLDALARSLRARRLRGVSLPEEFALIARHFRPLRARAGWT